MIIGITGGIGAGKSTVMEYMSEHYSVYPILADDVARELQHSGTTLFQQIVEWLGSQAVAKDGELNRGYVAEMVFASDENQKKMNALVHPAVREEIVKRINEQKSKYKHVAVEAALLIEEHYETICDEIWYIDALDEIRIQRLMGSRLYTREKCESIMKKQLDRQTFLKCSNRVIDNSRDEKFLKQQLDELLQ